MARQTTAQKAKVTQKKQCGTCGEIFTGTTCPNCEEKVNIYPINKDELPMADVANAIGATHSLPIRLQRSPEFDPEFELEEATRRQMKDVLQEAQLDKVKAAAALQAAKRLRAEKELSDTEKGFMTPKEGKEPQQINQGMGGMSSAMFMQALGEWNHEARETLFDRLKEDPEFAFNFSKVLNPPPGLPGMPQMNPMGWMGGMMQQPVEQQPQMSASDMLTSVVAAVVSLKDLSSSNDNNNSSMERILDKMDEMRKETENLRLEMAEERNRKQGVSPDEVRVIVSDVVSKSSAQQANIQEGIQVLDSIKSFKEGLLDLGLVDEVRRGDDKPTLDERRFDHEVKMDDLREKRAHELRLEAEKAEQAAAEAKGAFINGLFSAVSKNQEPENEEEPDVDTIEVTKSPTTRPSAVIS